MCKGSSELYAKYQVVYTHYRSYALKRQTISAINCSSANGVNMGICGQTEAPEAKHLACIDDQSQM